MQHLKEDIVQTEFTKEQLIYLTCLTGQVVRGPSCAHSIYDTLSAKVKESMNINRKSLLMRGPSHTLEFDMWEEKISSHFSPSWQETLSKKQRLCWVSDESAEDRGEVALITGYHENVMHSYSTESLMFKFATPLTDDEIKNLLS